MRVIRNYAYASQGKRFVHTELAEKKGRHANRKAGEPAACYYLNKKDGSVVHVSWIKHGYVKEVEL